MNLTETEKYFARRIVSFYKDELTYYREADSVNHELVLAWVAKYLQPPSAVQTAQGQLPFPLFAVLEDDGA